MRGGWWRTMACFCCSTSRASLGAGRRVCGGTAVAKRVMEAKSALDWSDVTMVSSGPLTDEQCLNVPGGYAEGTLGFCHYPDPAVTSEPGISQYQDLMRRYYPGRPMNRYSLYGYVFGRLVIEGLERTGPNRTRERFIDAMESIEAPVCLTYRFNASKRICCSSGSWRGSSNSPAGNPLNCRM